MASLIPMSPRAQCVAAVVAVTVAGCLLVAWRPPAPENTHPASVASHRDRSFGAALVPTQRGISERHPGQLDIAVLPVKHDAEPRITIGDAWGARGTAAQAWLRARAVTLPDQFAADSHRVNLLIPREMAAAGLPDSKVRTTAPAGRGVPAMANAKNLTRLIDDQISETGGS